MIEKQIANNLTKTLKNLGPDKAKVHLEHPAEEIHGDYSTNIALILANKVKKKPLELAKKIVEKLNEDKELTKVAAKIEIAGPGFINFYISSECLVNEMYQYIETKRELKLDTQKDKKIMVEFADPNPFKEFHIGHLRNIALGESFSRFLEANGARVWRVNYQGDVGLHIAKVLWAIKKLKMANKTINDLGKAYAAGNKAYQENHIAEKEIQSINLAVYQQDKTITNLWQKGRQLSLDYFANIYKRVYTKFDHFYFESEVAKSSVKLVKRYLDGVFKKSEGAIIFDGQKYGLHKRVFVTKDNYATYEAKDLALAPFKYKHFPYDLSIIITGREQKDYFKVLIKALTLINKPLGEKTKHISFGMVKLKTGKMSSRDGTIIEANWLLDEVKKRLKAEFNCAEAAAEIIAVGAVKYSMLKINPQSDLIFDINESISLEGNSGPYLQYTYARAQSVLRKSQIPNPKSQIISKFKIQNSKLNTEEITILRTIYKFSEVVSLAAKNYAPNLICQFLYDLAQKYNAFYNKHRIIDSSTENFRLALTKAASQIIKTGLNLLAIKVLEKM